MEHQVDIVVPVYHEKETFPAFCDYLAKHLTSDWRLLVVYDTPDDPTLEAAKPIAEMDPRVRLVFNPERGVLGAVKTGFRNAEAEAVLEVMVDDPPEVLSKIDQMVKILYEEGAAVVVASRYMKGGGHREGPLLKGLLSRLASISLHWLINLPTHDATYNTRLYRKSLLNRITIESKKGLEIALEITIKAHLAGEKIVEIPVVWTERTAGKSKFKILNWLGAYCYWYWFGIRYYWMGSAKRMFRRPG